MGIIVCLLNGCENVDQSNIDLTLILQLKTKSKKEEFGGMQHFRCWQHRFYVSSHVASAGDIALYSMSCR